MSLFIGLPTLWKLVFPRDGAQRGWKSPSFRKLVFAVAFHNFFHAVFVRSESAGPVHTGDKRITQGCEGQEMGDPWGLF